MPNKQLIVKKIQEALRDSFVSRKERGLDINNNKWNDNYNFIFSALKKLHGKNGLSVFQFNRHGFNMICFYDKNEKTLYSLCGEQRLYSLMSRRVVNRLHYTDALCMCSTHETGKQYNMFGEEVDFETDENKEDLLNLILPEIKLQHDIEEYVILEVNINHNACELNKICAKYISKNYELLKTDDSWNKYIIPSYNILDFEEQNLTTEIYNTDIKIKEPIKIELKQKALKQKEVK